MIDVATLADAAAGWTASTIVYGISINDSGTMTGNAQGPTNRNGSIYSGGPTGGSANVTLLKSLSGALSGLNTGYGFGINSSGQVAGGFGNKAFFYNGSTTSQPTDPYGGISNAYAINDVGRMVGNRQGISPTQKTTRSIRTTVERCNPCSPTTPRESRTASIMRTRP